jgi:hypothetical protein
VRRPREARVCALLEAAQRRRRRQRLDARHRRLERGITAQRIMIVEIAVSERDAEDTLAQQRRQGMIDIAPIALVDESPADLFQQTGASFRFTQQHRAAIRGDRATVESRLDDPAPQA